MEQQNELLRSEEEADRNGIVHERMKLSVSLGRCPVKLDVEICMLKIH